MSIIKNVTLIATSLLFLATTATPANFAEQVVFSGTGSGNFDGQDTPFGFWVWCASESDGNNGVYLADNACQGALYFYALGITKGVGSFPQKPGIVEDADGIYTMQHLHSADGVVDECELHNFSSRKGPRNDVHLHCDSPAGDGDSHNAVVNVTGPPE